MREAMQGKRFPLHGLSLCGLQTAYSQVQGRLLSWVKSVLANR